MAVSSLPQGIIPSPGSGIVLNGDARPVMDSVLQSPVAGQAADHEALLTAAPRDRSHPCQSAQGVIVSSAHGLCGLGEQCGEIDSADSWPGAKDRHVTLLEALPRRVLLVRFEPGAEPVQALLRLLDLLIEQTQARGEAADMRAGGFRGAWRDGQRCLAQGLQYCRRIEA